jgi:hypothetical protein
MLLVVCKYQVKGLRSFGSKRVAPASGTSETAWGGFLRRVPRHVGREGAALLNGGEARPGGRALPQAPYIHLTFTCEFFKCEK